MSLMIDVDKVSKVLLADGWHEVAETRGNPPASSFDLDAYEFVAGEDLLHGGGDSGICSVGFRFETSDGDVISGPLTAVLAVQVNET